MNEKGELFDSPEGLHAIQLLAQNIDREFRDDFGVVQPGLGERLAREYLDLHFSAGWRFDDLEALGLTPNTLSIPRILDLSAGYGNAVFFGRKRGYAVFGIEPNPKKNRLAPVVLKALGLPPDWRKALVPALGEGLPFRANSFDAVISYQTLEHVQNLKAVLSEMIRVVKPGGYLQIRCPDYSGTYEGHYLIPWFPYLPPSLARIYLRMLGRPLQGLATLNGITSRRLYQELKTIEGHAQGKIHLHIQEMRDIRLWKKLHDHAPRGLWALLPSDPYSSWLAPWRWAHSCKQLLTTLFRIEKTIHIQIQVFKS